MSKFFVKKERKGSAFRSILLEQAQFFSHLITTLSFARARSRSEELEQAQFFSHLITTLRPFIM